MHPSTAITLPVIGYIRSPMSQKFGIPRQPNLVNIPAVIEFVPPFGDPRAFEGLADFSHIWVVWQFHQNRTQSDAAHFRPQVRPPRLGGNQKLGVFATRSMYRPSQLGLSVVQLVSIDSQDGQASQDGQNSQNNQNSQSANSTVTLHILGGDMVDGTPVVDIKPYIAYSDSLADARSGFAEHRPLQKSVAMSAHVHEQLNQLTALKQLTAADIELICQLLAQDPRPAYRQTERNTTFTMRYRAFDIDFVQTAETHLQWVGITPLAINNNQ